MAEQKKTIDEELMKMASEASGFEAFKESEEFQALLNEYGGY